MQARGARTVNLLGGEPTCSLPGIIRSYGGFDDTPPVVWNSNLYFSEFALPAVLALADMFLGGRQVRQ